ncbi:DUF445 family protein [Negadavirga shengliensis]|uniref:DUF445 family protein n=1 Tax=Negadavirga shengliensis TaxID=1389218 RepID=A0ABV9T5Y6_9BACT
MKSRTWGIVELITTKCLSPEMLREKLAGVEIAKNVVQVLEEPHNMDRTLDFIRTVFYRFTEDLDHPKMAVLLQKLLKDQIQDLDIAGPLDSWLKESLEKLVDKYHPELGNIVRSSLGRLDDHGMMQQIKDKVGDDLQYIRLNGAVVGGLVGIVIAVLRWLLL